MSSDDAQELPRIPELEADYELIRELGRGGTAVVFLARERELGRYVAIKLIRPRYVQDDDAVARLVREARTVGRLQHPNIVMLLGARRLGRRELALILQFVPGITLKERVRTEGALPYAEAERILVDLGRALAYAHRHRIVHRDIKPENVYLDEESGTARLADFGIARVWDSDSGLTLPGTAIGTPAYMSPEQVDGRDLDGRSDLFSLGLVGYEMLTGERPWTGEGLYNIIYKQKHEELPPLTERCPGLPARIRDALEGALQKAPEDRWANAEEFLGALQGTAGSAAEWPVGADTQPDSAAGDTVPASPMEDQQTILYRRPAADQPPVQADVGPTRDDVAQDRGAPRQGARPPPPRGAPSSSPPAWLRAGKGRRSDQTDPHGSWPPGSPPPAWLEAEFDDDRAARSPRRSFLRRRRHSLLRHVTSVRGAAVLVLVVLIAGGALALSPGGDEYARALLGRLRPLLGAALPDPEGAGEAAPGPRGSGAPAPRGGAGALAGAPSAVSGTGRELPAGARVEGPGALDQADPASPGTTSKPASVLVLGDRARTGAAGIPLPDPVIVQVVDEQGNGVPGVDVTFEIASGGGSVRPAGDVTDLEGTASTAWTLGAGDGIQTLRAAVSASGGAEIVAEIAAQLTSGAGADSIAAVVAAGDRNTANSAADTVATPSAPAAIQILGGSDQQAPPGAALPVALQVLIMDEEGRALADVPVRFNVTVGGGTVDPAIAVTDARGIARVGWTLGFQEGRQQVHVLVDGAPSLTADFLATSAAPRLPIRSAVVAGGTHSCSLRADGSLVCWGANENGQLGDGTESMRLSPGTAVAGGPFAAVATGVSHTCALMTTGRIACWGLNDSGQLGDGSRTSHASPEPAVGDWAFVAVTAGASHTCALAGGGAAYCWGANEHGQLGDGSTRQSSAPVRVESPVAFDEIAAGWHHTCALDEAGVAYCWGSNESGQAGGAGGEPIPTPAPVAGGHRFQSIAAGSGHTCALTAQGRILCWGANGHGQLGDGTEQSRHTPVPVFDTGPFAEVVAGGIHSCGLTTSGALRCWGGNGYGQLGDGSTSDRSTPVAVDGDIEFTQVHALGSHTCGNTSSGAVLCWGYNVDGQLGDGTRENRSVPTPVM